MIASKICAVAVWSAICLGAVAPTQAKIIAARSISREDVASAVFSAHDGDEVQVPAGRSDWRETLTVNKAITLRFAGIGQSVILDDVEPPAGRNPGPMQAVIDLTVPNRKVCRLSGLEIDRGARTNIFFKGEVQISGAGVCFRVDHCAFNQVLNNAVYASAAACGVVDHCFFNMEGGQHAVLVTHERWAGETLGDGSWDTPALWGTENAVYMEDCVFTNATKRPWWVVDSWSGARWVFRHNQIFSGNLSAHGTESGGRNRGTRSCEVYLNEFHEANLWPNAIELRSSSAVIWSNAAVGPYRMFCSIDDYRSSDNYKFWGGADGTNPLDENEPGPVLVAAHTGQRGSPNLIVNGANWKTDQWRGYRVVNTALTGVTNFGTVWSNNASVAYFIPTARHGSIVFNPGDTVKFYRVIAALDMPGMGQTDRLKRNMNGDPQGPWPNQRIEPLYAWGNTLNGGDGRITARNAMMVEGVHYFNDTPKQGYTPFTYPHPLTLLP